MPYKRSVMNSDTFSVAEKTRGNRARGFFTASKREGWGSPLPFFHRAEQTQAGGEGALSAPESTKAGSMARAEDWTWSSFPDKKVGRCVRAPEFVTGNKLRNLAAGAHFFLDTIDDWADRKST